MENLCIALTLVLAETAMENLCIAWTLWLAREALVLLESK